jgi:hypothetical protein
MRDLVIAKLTEAIRMTSGYGIPRYFDCDEDDTIADPAELDAMTDEALLEVFEATVGFQG